MRIIAKLFIPALLICSLPSSVQAQEFYKGKNVTFVIGFGVGNGYDTYSRTVARRR